MAKKLKEIKQTNGELVQTTPSSLEQLWGLTGAEKYGTMDVAEYETSLAEMNKADLYREALKRNLMPTDQRENLKRKLVKAFNSYIASFNFPVNPIQPVTPSKEILKILADGK